MEQIRKIIDFIKRSLNFTNKKKVIENTIIVIIIGIIIIIAGGSLFGNKAPDEAAAATPQPDASKAAGIISSSDKDDEEKRVEAILSQINGVGKVSVMITYYSGEEMVPAYDSKNNNSDTQEKDSGGGTRSIKENSSESSVVYQEGKDGVKSPVVLKEMQPQVKGVVVVADGADDIGVRESLSMAVQALLDVPLHKIQVFERKR